MMPGLMSRLAIFLRGINVGAHNRIGMADLRELLDEQGFEGIRTHLQSGNAVLRAKKSPAVVQRAVSAAIHDRFGLEIEVIARTAAELAAVVAADPLGSVATDPSRHFVAFLSAKPRAAVVRALEEDDHGSEQLVVKGREIYVWCPEGLRDSRVMKTLTPKRLGVAPTVRNWNTVTKVLELVEGS
jgi:uncharacterized protein (DUF1697 family)